MKADIYSHASHLSRSIPQYLHKSVELFGDSRGDAAAMRRVNDRGGGQHVDILHNSPFSHPPLPFGLLHLARGGSSSISIEHTAFRI